MTETKTVKMWLEAPRYPGEPLTADVAVSEVANWQSYGWQLVPEAAAKTESAKTNQQKGKGK